MSFIDPIGAQPRLSPTMFVGAASPLWMYFSAAAAGGLAYWWMTRWARPGNLEAMFNAAALAVPKAETVAAAIEKAVEPVVAALEPATPVGGEAAPISPLAVEPESPVLPTEDAEVEAAAEADESESEPTPKAKAKKSGSSPTVN